MEDTWGNIQGGFLDYLEQVNEDLKAVGLPALESHLSGGSKARVEEAHVNGNGTA